ncbi:ABC transporter ATP-binding protein [Halovulum sp. GXIMD14794]
MSQQTAMRGIDVETDQLQINFSDFVALRPTDLAIKRGELFTLLGPSGCGKTTLLRCLAGFLKPSNGRVLFDGQDVSRVDPWNRGIGFVFQNYALWPTKTIARNVAYGLEMRGFGKAEIARKVEDALALVDLTRAAQQYPGELSGGMQQRAALARAIIIDPPLLLFDEPLSNLDAKLRVKLRRDIRDLVTRLGLTAIYVTHDQEEALDISDRIAVMRQGRVMQVGSPREIYASPQSAFVADFVGKASFLEGRASGPDTFRLTDGTTIRGVFKPHSTPENGRVLFARPEDFGVVGAGQGDVDGIVEEVSYLGHVTRYRVGIAGQSILVETRDAIEPGATVGLRLPPMQMFDAMPETKPEEEEN